MVLLRADRLAVAIARNQAHRLSIPAVVRRITGARQRGGNAWSARHIERHVDHVLEVFSTIAEHVPDVKGKVGLEIGPGDDVGVAYGFLKAGCAKMFAVEQYPSVVLDARLAEVLVEIDRRLGREAMREGVTAGEVLRHDGGGFVLDAQRLDLRQGRIEDVSLDREVDFIYSNDVLEHVESPARFFRTAERLLRQGGVLVSNIDLAGHNVFGDPRRPLDFLSCPDYLWSLLFSHVATTNRVRLPEFVAAAEGAGLRVRQIEPLVTADRDYLASVRPHLLPRYRALSDESLAVVQCILVAQKPAPPSDARPS